MEKPAVPPIEDKDKLALPHALDLVVERLLVPMMMSEIAMELGVSPSRLTRWCAADSQRLARVREARRLSALLWVEKAEKVIAEATDDLSLKKARELAHHYRWKASKINVEDFGDKVEHTVQDVRTASTKQLAGELQALGLGDLAGVLLQQAEGKAVH